jgi:hypothetical protein
MKPFSEVMSERFVSCSKSIVLECDGCGKKLSIEDSR